MGNKDFHKVYLSLCSGSKEALSTGVERGKDRYCFCSTYLGCSNAPKINNQQSHRDLWPCQAGIDVSKILLTFEISLGLN